MVQERASVNQCEESEAYNVYPVVQPVVLEVLMACGFQQPVNEQLVTKLRSMRCITGEWEQVSGG